jgi:ABC-type Fe3+-hydroxamate transport system substrate-binding protein
MIGKRSAIVTTVFAAMIVVTLLASACVSSTSPTPNTSQVLPAISPQAAPPGTPLPVSNTTVPESTPPGVICSCPMIPVVSSTVTPSTTQSTGPCHCPT